MLSIEEAQANFFQNLQYLQCNMSQEDWQSGKLFQGMSKIYPNWAFDQDTYVPRPDLAKRLNDLKEWEEGNRSENEGQLIEEIAALAFGSIQGRDTIESYQSYSAQYDLVVSGSSPEWMLLMTYWHLPNTGRTIIVEAKNLAESISDSQVSRLCSIVEQKFPSLCHLGVFFSMTDISGSATTRVLRDGRATQVLFHASTKKYIIAICRQEFDFLLQPGGLLRLIETKIRDIEAVSSLPAIPDGATDWKKVNLPPHIGRHFHLNNDQTNRATDS